MTRPLLALAAAVLMGAAATGCAGGDEGPVIVGVLHGDQASHCVWLTTSHGNVEVLPPHHWGLEFSHDKAEVLHYGHLVAVEGQRVKAEVRGSHRGAPGCPLDDGHPVRLITGPRPVTPKQLPG